MVDVLLAGLVLAAMAALGAVDARRMIVAPRLILLLVGSGLLWRLFGSADAGSLWEAGLGALLGIAVVAMPIALAQVRGRPWPLFPGDAMMLGGLGFVLGPLGLGWTLLAGSALSLVHRVWLQRRRGRHFRRGYCPLGPGMAAGAMAVFLFVNAGGSLAADGAAVPLPAPRPGLPAEADGTPMLPATELAPGRVPLPAHLAAREIAVGETAPLSFEDAIERIATLAGVRFEVEERSARVSGGAAVLPDPPAVRLAFEGRLPGLLDRVAAHAGYDWTWRDELVVFYRYWDIEQRMPEAPADVRRAEQRSGEWTVDRARHGTLREVLEDWAARAGWTVVWKPARGYAIGADASFSGGFLEAVDGLLAGPVTRRSLVALAHEPNRHLVIEDAGAVR